MSDGYVGQALTLALLALLLFLIISALLFATARGAQFYADDADPFARLFLNEGVSPLPDWTEGFAEACCASKFSALHRWTRHWARSKRTSRRSYRDDSGLRARYNRVEGLYLGVQLDRDRFRRRRYYNFAVYGEGGYGFKSKAWRYQVGLEHWFSLSKSRRSPLYRFVVGGEAHDLTATEDEWVIPSSENSLAAFLLKEDFQDFYRRVGMSGYLEEEVMDQLSIRAEYRVDRLYNMPPDSAVRKATNWSLFGGNKEFRPNPLIDEGQFRGAVARVVFDTRDRESAPDHGWYIQAQAEFYGGQVRSDYEFDRLIVDVRRYQPIGYGENLDLRLRAGSSRGALPVQFLFDLGGISTLRGHRFKELTGNRMVLANLEYRIRAGSDVLPDLFLIPFGALNLILFVDAGLAWSAQDVSRFDRGFRELRWSDLKTDVGVALTDRRGKVRLNVARRTDVGSAPIVVTFRINRAF